VVAISFHFDCQLVQEARSTFPYFRHALHDLAQRFTLIGHGHPKAFAYLAHRYRREGIEPVEDFADVCRRADLYICDNSSTLYEFASTGRPVVVLNEPPGFRLDRGYRPNVNHGLRFWEAAGVGLNCDRPKHLVSTVERALVDHEQARAGREAALDIVYGRRTGAAKRAADAIIDWAGITVASEPVVVAA
jgi:UDP-N-acetylglucosamine:LPS N-acetylglucosamine transferase